MPTVSCGRFLLRRAGAAIKIVGGVKPPLDAFMDRLQTHTRVQVWLGQSASGVQRR